VPVFKPITDPRDLPKPEEGTEGLSLDAKTSARKGANAPPAPFDDLELAKDVAAFANALGGTLLVGAHEDTARGVIDRYVALTEVDALETLQHYNDAVSTRCSPRPLIQPERLPFDGGFLVAVNVWPFLGQLVGVSDSGLGSQGRMFHFPYRVGRATAWIEPEQHAMFMIPTIRRTIVLLESIPQGPHTAVQIVRSSPGIADLGSASFMGVDIPGNVAIFQKGDGPGRTTTFHIALDDIERVWRAAGDQWRIRLVSGARVA